MTGRRSSLAALLGALLASSPAALAAADRATELRFSDGAAVRLLAPTARDAAPAFALLRPDGTWTSPRPLDPVVHLRYDARDPRTDAARPVPPALTARPEGRLFLVQCASQWLAAYGDALADLGAEVHQPVPATARIVRMDPALVPLVEALPFVRWVGPLHPAYRADESLLAAFDGDAFALPPRRCVVRMVDPTTDRAILADRLAALGAVVDRADAGALILEATLDGAQLAAALALDEVLFIDPWSAYETDMDVAREIGGANLLESVAGYDGAGVRGEVMDGGFNLGHVDFASRPLIQHTAVSSASHGASTSGIVFGDGTGNASRRGLLPEGQGIVADFDTGVFEGPSRHAHTAQLVQAPYEAVFQSCSFGSSLTTSYTNVSAEMDQIILDFDLTIAQSQSNAGSQSSRPQAWAKNIVSVGGVVHHGTLDKADDNWSGASIGPAADGRIKPDLTHFYDGIGTVDCCGSTSYTTSFGGTSGATPIVAGYFGLFYDMWADGVFGNEVLPGGDVFENRCHQTTAKAMLINTAAPYDWTQGGANGNLTRTRQGWGMPSVEAIWTRRERMLVVDEDEVLPNLGVASYVVAVLPGEPALRATLTWADLPGTTNASLHRINDLDLRVIAPTGETYRGNVGLANGIWSSPGGAADGVNTVENVFVANPAPGSWTIEVEAADLNADGHVETPALDADFALVASGVLVTPPPLVVRLASPLPELLPPGATLEVEADIFAGTESLVDGSAVLRWRTDPDAPFADLPLLPVPGVADRYVAVMPGLPCGEPEFLLGATGDGGSVVTSPANAPVVLHRYPVGAIASIVDQDFETTGGWTVVDENVADGSWERGVPVLGGIPNIDFDGSGSCWQTGIAPQHEVDGGPTRLLSEIYDLTGVADPIVSYARYVFIFGDASNHLEVEISNDGGATWVEVGTFGGTSGQWIEDSFAVRSLVEPTDAVQLRFSAIDPGTDNGVEAAIDAVRIEGAICGGDPADLDGNGTVDFADLLLLLSGWGTCGDPCPADLDGDLDVGFGDLLLLLSAWTA